MTASKKGDFGDKRNCLGSGQLGDRPRTCASTWILASLLLAACHPALSEAGDRPLSGSWGGAHVSLHLTNRGGALEYDCASGTIDGPVRPDRNGSFMARGTHVPGQGGPERLGYEPPRLPAIYSGRVRGGIMTLLVRLQRTGAEIGPYTLRKGGEPSLVRCL